MSRRRVLKPTKKQKAMMELLRAIEVDGTIFALDTLDAQERLLIIDNESLSALVESFNKVAAELDACLLKMEQEVQPFIEDEDEF